MGKLPARAKGSHAGFLLFFAVSVGTSACAPPSMETAPVSLSPDPSAAGTPEGTPSLAGKGTEISQGDVGKFNLPDDGLVDKDVVPMFKGPVVQTREQHTCQWEFETLSDL